MVEDKSLIAKWLGEQSLPISVEQIDKLILYLKMIRETSKKMNLVSKNDLPHLVERHLLDSLVALTVFEFAQGTHVADLGSGAGFPGIPIAIVRPDLRIELIESRRLKALFLKSVVDSLNLANVKVIHERWENLSGTFNIILARAVYSESDLRKWALPRLNDGGALLYYAKLGNIKIIQRD
jgi:16S rRNA (guanine527-N7)-methyltransferase